MKTTAWADGALTRRKKVDGVVSVTAWPSGHVSFRLADGTEATEWQAVWVPTIVRAR